MSALENIKGKFKEFGPTTWSIKNKTSIYLMMLIVSMIGIYQFVTLPERTIPRHSNPHHICANHLRGQFSQGYREPGNPPD